MESTLEHERKRFSYMDAKQLRTRLYRITKKEKLRAFIKTAQSYGHNYLAAIAEDRYNTLFNSGAKKTAFPSEEQEPRFLSKSPEIKFWEPKQGRSYAITVLPSGKEQQPQAGEGPPPKEQKPKKPYKRSLEF